MVGGLEVVFDIMDAFWKELDALMGAYCNGNVLEVKRNYWDCNVCCLYVTAIYVFMTSFNLQYV